MQFTEAQISQWLAGFMWPLLRIGAMLMAAPIFNIRQVRYRQYGRFVNFANQGARKFKLP